jgi:molybdopterin-guanine dinucleotide biosynthesis protein A
MGVDRGPIGAVLAGGQGRRIGGSKATVKLRGKPLISYPVAAMSSVLETVAVIAKADTELPSMPGITIWIEPEGRRHPAIGIIHALALASGRPVVVCAVDLPFVTPSLIHRIAGAGDSRTPAVIASHGGCVQPLLGVYRQAAATRLQGASDRPLRELVAAIGPQLFEVDDVDELFNVNAPDDLLQAAAMLDQRYPKVKS